MAEVEGIYDGLVIVENKCIDLDEKQLALAKEEDQHRKGSLENGQWRALIAVYLPVYYRPTLVTYRAALLSAHSSFVV